MFNVNVWRVLKVGIFREVILSVTSYCTFGGRGEIEIEKNLIRGEGVDLIEIGKNTKKNLVKYTVVVSVSVLFRLLCVSCE